MKLMRSVFWSANNALSHQFRNPCGGRAFSARPLRATGKDDAEDMNSSESADDFTRRIFGEGGSASYDTFFQKLDKAEKAHSRPGMGFSMGSGNNSSSIFDGLGEGETTLDDWMGTKLKKAAVYFEFDPDEVSRQDYSFRPDVTFSSGMTYDIKDLDLKKPGVSKPVKRGKFETTTEEVLLKADFRNVRFLAKFITESGIINKRSNTGISAKAQRKVAREIKTARAFGLMPFTTMGTKAFIYGKTMEDEQRDFEYESYDHNFVDDERDGSLAS